MLSPELHVLVLAGGESTRIRTGGPKALLDLCGKPLLEHVLRTASSLPAASRVLLLGSRHRGPIEKWLAESAYRDWKVVLQAEAKGTGHAVAAALPVLPPAGRLLILYGDTPLLSPDSLRALVEAEGGGLLTAVLADPAGYGRIVRDEPGELRAIVEDADCDEETAAIQEVNAGVYCLDLAILRRALAELTADNAQGELYLTDAALAVLEETGGVTVCLENAPEEILGVNTLQDLALVAGVRRQLLLEEHMAAGVIVDDPATTYVEEDVQIGAGSRIGPFSVLRSGVRIGRGCHVGPFAHLRAGTVLADGAEIGNFVETKNAELGEGAKAKHLSYLGDVAVGARANIGAGTITANYDGKAKHRTVVGERAFIGSGTVLVAPVRVGRNAVTGAGAVVTRNHDVADGATVVGVPARPLHVPAAEKPE
ncbi:MAG: hypothetical protein EYC70_12095 [Planctomycetota bacterium]|nr:MAG: hypothetical protein EYC70_12095 [Planctomycetota bacterium]